MAKKKEFTPPPAENMEGRLTETTETVTAGIDALIDTVANLPEGYDGPLPELSQDAKAFIRERSKLLRTKGELILDNFFKEWCVKCPVLDHLTLKDSDLEDNAGALCPEETLDTCPILMQVREVRRILAMPPPAPIPAHMLAHPHDTPLSNIFRGESILETQNRIDEEGGL